MSGQAPPDGSPPGFRLLLVEDQPEDTELLCALLREAPDVAWHMEAVATVAAACAQLARRDFDAILTDLHLPDSCGSETVRALQQAAPDTPLVVLTGRYGNRDGVESIRCGADDYLVKGDSRSHEICRCLRYAIERRMAGRHLRELRVQLESAHRRALALEGLLPICSVCKCIRDEDDRWLPIEDYICDHSSAHFTHGYCPTCAARALAEIEADWARSPTTQEPPHG